MKLTTLGDLLQWAEAQFEASDLYFGHGTDNAWDEAVVIALSVLRLPAETDESVKERVLSADERDQIVALVQKRIETRHPLPYLTGEAWFADLKFYVDPRVLIPRSPLAELILNDFQPWRGDKPLHKILDLCTGGGCIAIACATYYKEAAVDAIDLSEEALAVAQKNVELHGCSDRVRLIQSNLFSGCPLEQYDLIISNPPYVSRVEIEEMPKEYQFEPKLALEAGEDGLTIVKTILAEAFAYLRPEGLLLVEVGSAEEALQQEYPHLPFTWVEFERGGTGVFALKKGSEGWLPVF